MQNYRFTDEEPPSRLTYYRLKQVEKSGRFSYSELRLVNMEKQADNRVPQPIFRYLKT